MDVAIRPTRGFLLQSTAPHNLRIASFCDNTCIVHWRNGHRPRMRAHALTRWPNHVGQVNNTLLVNHSHKPPNLPACRNLGRGSPYTDSRSMRTGPSQLGPITPKARTIEKGSGG